MAKKDVLFITAPIRSHIIPSFYLANLLSHNYTIHYLVANDILKELVESQGYNTFLNENKANRLNTKEMNKSFWDYIISEVKMAAFKERQQTIKQTITTLNPSIVIIDIFSFNDILVIHHFFDRLKIFFFNPMVSTYPLEDFPTVAGKNEREQRKPKKIKIVNYFNPIFILNETIKAYNKRKIRKTCNADFKQILSEDGVFTKLYKDFPEFVSAPLEFEYSHEVKKDNQIYLGLCTYRQRVDTELDATFESKFSVIKEKRAVGEKIIYCSFGTFYSGSNIPILNFLKTLVEAAIDIPHIQIICSINEIVSQTLLHQIAVCDNIHFFSRTPQLKVLEHTDLHITHGGLSSIKESIYYNVPMLVYPLDLTYDQYGNSLKVDYHKIGVKGILRLEQPNNLRDNIINVLSDNSYRENIRLLNKKITNNYLPKMQLQVIENLISV